MGSSKVDDEETHRRPQGFVDDHPHGKAVAIALRKPAKRSG
jgi:hypothetical protein